jgi:ribokinase
MSDYSTQGPTEASLLVPVFESLRRYDGLTAKRLQSARVAQPLLRLTAVQNQAVRSGSRPAEAAIEVIVEQIQHLESVTDRMIADAILNLGIYLKLYRKHKLSTRGLWTLQNGGLGARRKFLVEYWEPLHEAHGAATQTEPPGEHTLRGRIESEVFERLAALLLDPSPTAETPMVTESVSAPAPVAPGSTAAGSVVVIGGVAIDHIWRIRSIPDIATSEMAMDYTRSPGGKGFSQAVAAAHLELNVSLIAAIAADDDGKQIETELVREDVDTSLLQKVQQSGDRRPRTTTTGVFELPTGNSSAVVWRGGVELDIPTIDRHAEAITSCDVLLLTFELPQYVLKHTLNLVGSASSHPVVIVTPGQPYADGHLLSPVMEHVDYLVAHLWELEGFAFSDESKYDPQLLSDDLLSLGLGALCLLVDRGGTVYRYGEPQEPIPARHGKAKDYSITRDAFCAALAARLVDHATLTSDDIRWAAAAMACFDEASHRAPLHPTRAAVDEKFRTLFGGDD